ncbi:DUF1501 domain-containing protein [Vibrio astriarenae]|jgi:uncharacterized protein (DUF1501 family)
MKLSRRSFLKGGVSAAGVTALNLTSPAAHALTSRCDNTMPYKALVGINLGGGNDGFNCFVPKNSAKYDDYKTLRTSLAFERNELLELNLSDQQLDLALSPELEAIKWLFDEGKGLPVLNVGPLMKERTENVDIDTLKPVHIFSHNHQSAVTQTHTADTITNQGWGGLSAHLLENAFSLEELTPIFEMGSQTVWTNSIPKSANRIGTKMPNDMPLKDLGSELYDAFRRDYMTQGSIYKEYYAEQCYEAQDKFDEFEQIFADTRDFGFDEDSSIGQQLRVILLLLLNRDKFQQPAQFFSATLGGFDTHSAQKVNQGELLRELASQISVFYQRLDEFGLTESVTTFTFSEFGRTLEPNGSGTDHGWGNCHFVLGGDVHGGRILGDWPNLAPGSDDLLSRGRVVPTMSVDLFHASLLKWMGVHETGLETLFPSLKDFAQKSLPIFRNCDSGNDSKLTISGATASGENANGIDKIEHGIDGDFNTKWSAKGVGTIYTVELNKQSTVHALKFAQAQGDVRKYFIDIETSIDGSHYEYLMAVTTDGISSDLVEYSVGSVEAKYIRFICNGNTDTNISLREWNNFRHIEVWGR